MPSKGTRPWRFLAVAFAGVAAVAACGPDAELPLPTAADVEGAFLYGGELTGSMSGNVAEIRIRQSAGQLQRGGTLWAKMGPYVILFSEETRDLLVDYPGLAGVRVITETAGGVEVARAFMRRDALNGITWKRALNIAGLARRDGTEQLSRIEDLIEWGEDHTEFEYNPRYVRRR